MNSMIILTLISLAVLAMGFLGILLPFVSVGKRSKKISIKDMHWIENDLPEIEDDPKIAYKVIKKQLRPLVNLKRLNTLIPKDDEHLFRIRTIKRKVPDI